MNLIIKIEMDNSAFAIDNEGWEASRILRNVAKAIDGISLDTNFAMKLYDINGNPVGFVVVEE